MSERHTDEPRPGDRTLTGPPPSTALVLWHLLRVSALWLLIAAGLIWTWVSWSDVEPWTAWISGVVAIHIAVPAYSVTGLGQRLGRRAMARGQLALGWACMLVLTIGTTLALALALAVRSSESVSPPFLTLLVCTVLPALMFTACLLTLPRLWRLGLGRGVAVSIAIILAALALCGLAVWQITGGPDWLTPALWVGSGAALVLAIYQIMRVPMENMNSISDL